MELNKQEMKVYGIYTGCSDEGGMVSPNLYLLRKKAEAAARKEIKSIDDFDPGSPKLEKRGTDHWCNGYNIVAIQTFTVE